MRDLASIVTIDKAWNLEGKDRVHGISMIENGYEAMVSKDIQPGMLVAFIQEGACLPVCETWEWLRKRCYHENLCGKEGFLIKPQKFSSIKSWGVVVPLNELGLSENVYKNFKSGDDITDLLGIWKYEPEEDASPKRSSNSNSYPKWIKFCFSKWYLRWIAKIWQKFNKKVSSEFPSWAISKSDETSLQNMKSVLERYKGSTVVITPKYEGQSCSIIPVFKGKKFVTAYPCSRNFAYPKENDTIFWKMMKKYDIISKMKQLWKEKSIAVIIQAEQVGPTIQQNIYDFKDNQWYVFTMKDYVTKKQLSYEKMKEVSRYLGLETVPLLASGNVDSFFTDLQSAIDFAERAVFVPKDDCTIFSSMIDKLNKKLLWKEYFQHEGIVVRSIDYDKDNGIGFSYKIKNLDYAEKGLGTINKAVKEYKIAEKIN